ncbi:Aste57867_18396 [Aphanomyces stellatus]|uniref:Aste57867_18396 protein n=1 Tax=Aphanomyces stellatus TaxID=120398 RepID=A0A485L9Z3_9STRA|nr:hypothetical protein As57867_018334 [Aphanomyces stellatus]VFT95132.1 Aste57867_18396 [Aphanomyces stellatus]
MGQTRYTCEYCNKSFTDTSESRRKHNQGRLHKIKVKEWYDHFHSSSSSPSQGAPSSQWIPVATSSDSSSALRLPPSMVPAPPTAFSSPHLLADWG